MSYVHNFSIDTYNQDAFSRNLSRIRLIEDIIKIFDTLTQTATHIKALNTKGRTMIVRA